MDLGAPPFRVFYESPCRSSRRASWRRRCSPSLSLDDFIITLFNAGNRVTYPLYVYGARAAFPRNVLGHRDSLQPCRGRHVPSGSAPSASGGHRHAVA
jgi:hypothetical protein